jgi:hypothetical protein
MGTQRTLQLGISLPYLVLEDDAVGKENVELTRMWHYSEVHAPDARLKSYKKKLDERIKNLKDRDNSGKVKRNSLTTINKWQVAAPHILK